LSPGLLYAFGRPALFALDPETAHDLTLRNLRIAESLGLGRLARVDVPTDERTVMGLKFRNPIGLAAGLDKDGVCVDGFALLGFGFIEVGTVTPRPQRGNPKPRVFRLVRAQALINRLGFNNHGVEALVASLREVRYRGVLGINIGKNADTPIGEATADYVTALRAVYVHASYVTINVSSPNTERLRSLQGSGELDALLAAVKSEQRSLADLYGRYVPLVVKIAPDLETADLSRIADTLLRNTVDGVIATNTTVSRKGVERQTHANEAGGLSGAPLFENSTEVIRTLKTHLRDDIPIIGVGGVMSGADARAKIDAGAVLVQLYTGLIYRGPHLVAECARALSKA